MAVSTMTGYTLSADMIIDIFSWLPVKTLLRFKSGCKSWYAITSSPNFISKHMENFYNNNDTDCLLIQYEDSEELFELLVDETPRVVSCKLLAICSSPIFGPSNGIFYADRCYPDNRSALWNPATNEVKILPPSMENPNFSSYNVFGFGFDPVNEDYKVVILQNCSDTYSYPLSLFVYSSNTDSWKHCVDLERESSLEEEISYVCLNGVLYRQGLEQAPSCGGPDWVISFDMTTNSISRIKVPKYRRTAALGVYHDSLAFFAVEKLINVWILSEGRWTRKFAIDPVLGPPKPLGHWKNDKIILESTSPKKLKICDIHTQEIRDFGHQGGYWCKRIFIYRKSIVSFKDRNA